MDRELGSTRIKVDNKQFFFDLRENEAGRYLKITEASARRSSIIVPAAGLESFRDAVSEILAALVRRPA